MGTLGEFAEPDFVRLPSLPDLFRIRSERLHALVTGNPLAPYLTFLAGIARAQAQLIADRPLAITTPPSAGQEWRAPLDRLRFVADGAVLSVSDALLGALAGIAMPEAAKDALASLQAGDEEARTHALQQVLSVPAPGEALAEHALLSAGLQIVFSALAARLDAALVQPGVEGLCPVCCSPPMASLLVGWPGARGTRYCACGLCGSLWNYVRIKCTLCGSTGGIAYQGVDGDTGTIKAETCEACHRYVKILNQQKAPALEALADDVGSLGLDLLMQESGFARGAVNPFLLGY